MHGVWQLRVSSLSGCLPEGGEGWGGGGQREPSCGAKQAARPRASRMQVHLGPNLDDPAWHRVLQETQAKVERGGRGGQEKMVFTVGMEQRGGARPLQSVQPPVPGGGGAQVRMRQVSDVFVDPFGHRKTAALNGRLYAEGLERQGCVAWLRTGVTMSDLNQKIFPCLRTNHLLLQVLMYSPCFISQPARSGPCQNSTSPASGFFPKRAFILVCLFPRVCRSRRPRTPSRPEKKDCAKLEV
mmetsp:Transcript_20626/g.57243  ORF Transcript_20626/g.57243 Transcript_20626/m.57243 type:complete len:241 (-) Transcript_20626:85-807(-)